MKLSLIAVVVCGLFTLCSTYMNHLMCEIRIGAQKQNITCIKEKLCHCNLKPLQCPAGYLRHENNCYWFGPVNVDISWPEARTLCESMSSYLAVVLTASESNFLKTYLNASATNAGYWIGAHDLQVQDTFNWATDGAPTPMIYTDWNTDQPNNFKNEQHCVDLRPEFIYEWNDSDCTDTQSLICMVKLVMQKC